MYNFSSSPFVTVTHGGMFINDLGGVNEYNYVFNVENPNAVDEDGNRIRGDAYAVLVLEKSLTRSEGEDKVCAELLFGTTTTTPLLMNSLYIYTTLRCAFRRL